MLMDNICIYRMIYEDGEHCMHPTESSLYCNAHMNKQNYVFEIMDKAISRNTIVDINDLYSLLTYLYDMPQQNCYNLSSKEMFMVIISYLLSKSKLISIIYKLIYLDGLQKYCKKNIIVMLHDILLNTYLFSYNSKRLQSVSKIQRFLRRQLHHKITQYNSCTPVNTEDPFTYDNIDEIPENCKFSYKDNNGHVYMFNAIELEYFIRNNDTYWNPYTKEDIPDYIVNRLHILMQYNGLHKKDQKQLVWQTNLQAYTEVSQCMERAGFYTDVCWFDKMTYNTCKNVIKLYRDLCRDVEGGSTYFPLQYELKQDFVFDFCKEVIRLFQNSDDHYMICCNFMKALAMNIDEFYKNLPSWLSNVESRLPVNSNELLYLYVQNMIDNFDAEEEAIDRVTFRVSGGLTRAMFYGMF